ncbi:hypothetical protein [Ruegeria sp.]|uniref:AbiU2 domain-containing protein n=1 Tax=Ruegeria sp. TaxID=1879320 RepID=UPI003B00A49F
MEAEKENECEFSAQLKELESDADQASWYIGFLKATVDNPDVCDRLNGSICGHAGVVARAGAKNSVILYCNRAWDEGHNVISLPKVMNILPGLEVLEARKRDRLDPALDAQDKQRLSSSLECLKAKYAAIKACPEKKAFRVLRSEWLAHRIIGSRDRVNAEKADLNVDGATYDDLLQFAEGTASLVGQLRYLWDQTVDPYPDKIKYATRIAGEFWRLIPVLKDVEAGNY